MQYYFCETCDEKHAVLDDSDMAERIVHCDSNGHVRNCVTPPEYNDNKHWHCAYCCRYITENQYNIARSKQTTVSN